MLGLVVVLLLGGRLGPFVKKLFFSTASKFCIFSDALASLKIMFKIKSVFQSCFQDFKITEYKRVLQSIIECYRVFLAHLLGPIFWLVFFEPLPHNYTHHVGL